MHLALISWTITGFFVFFVSGRSIEQIMIAAQVAIVGLILGYIAGKIGEILIANDIIPDRRW